MPGGRPAKPTALKALQGTARPDRINPHEPQPPVIVEAHPPAWLKGRGRKAWRELAGMLGDMRILTVPDQPALSLLCDAYGEYIEARAVVQREGMTYESKTMNGSIVRRRPEVEIAADAWRRTAAMLQQFGLTPSARAKVSAAPEGVPDDPLEAMFNEG